MSHFENFDLTNFWDESDYYRCPEPLTDALVQNAEQKLGFKLPASYIFLLKTQNGGTPVNKCFPVEGTYWASDHIAIESINGIEGQWGIDSDFCGSPYLIEEWGYPAIGIMICHCPSGGHDAVLLDYSDSGHQGEPAVIHVDVEICDENGQPTITYLAPNFEMFIRGLVNESVYNTSEADFQKAKQIIEFGEFSGLLQQMCQNSASIAPFDLIIRNICKTILLEKGYWAFHADPLSHLMYDIQFWLLSKLQKIENKEQFYEIYKNIIALSREFSTNGYGPGFVEDWFNLRIAENRIINDSGLRFTNEYQSLLLNEIEKYY